MVKKYIAEHDHTVSFFLLYLVMGIVLTLMLNLSVLLLFVLLHFGMDYAKYRMKRVTRRAALGNALRDQLIDGMFISISITLAVYLSHQTPGVVGLYSVRALEEVRVFSLVRALPRFALIEHLIKGFVHAAHHVRHHATHIRVRKFSDWEMFYLQMIIYSVLLIILAPAFIDITYAQVWQNILIEISPWHIGAH